MKSYELDDLIKQLELIREDYVYTSKDREVDYIMFDGVFADSNSISKAIKVLSENKDKIVDDC